MSGKRVRLCAVAAVVAAVVLGLVACDLGLYILNNPVDPDAAGYTGGLSVDGDGDGIGQYADVDEIVLLSPADGAAVETLEPVLTVYCFDPTRVSAYWVEVAAEATFAAPVVSADDYATNLCLVPAGKLENLRTYYWRAKAYDGVAGRWSASWSEARSFAVSIAVGVPVGPSPADGDTVVDTTPLLDWGDVSDAVTYHVQLGADETFASVVEEGSRLTTSGYQVATVLTHNTTYYWRARVCNAGGIYGAWSETWSFGIGLAAPSSPSPADGAETIDTTPLLDWGDSEVADSYYVQIGADETFASTVVDQSGLTASEYQVGTLLADNTTYYWRVRVGDGDGVLGSWSPAWRLTIEIPPPAPSSPSEGATVYDRTPLLGWGEVSGAGGYRVQVSTSATFSATEVDDNSLIATGYQVPAVLDPGITRYWRVRTKNADAVWGDWSSAWSFVAVGAGPAIGSWTTTASLETAREAHATVLYNGHVYVIGGYSGTYCSDVVYASMNADGTVGSWKAATSLTTARGWHTSVAHNGYLYAIGGNNGGGYLSSIEYAPIDADGSVGSWTAAPPGFTTARNGHTSAVHNGYLYVIGGGDGSSNYYDDVQYAPLNADGSVGNWQLASTAFPGARLGHTSVAYNGYLYVIGGYDGASHLNDVRYAPFEADGDIGDWSVATTGFSTARAGHASVVRNGYLYVLGGEVGASRLSDVQYAPIEGDGGTGTWATTTALAGPRRYHGVVANNGYLCVTGGWNGSYLSDVQFAPFE